MEVQLSQQFPECVHFINEHGVRTQVDIHYEWKPIECHVCHRLGHETINCKKAKKQQWIQKAVQKPEEAVENRHIEVPEKANIQKAQPEVDPEGFQKALKPIRMRVGQHKPTITSNVFGTLEGEAHGHGVDVDGMLDGEKGKSKLGGGGTLPLTMDRVLAWNVRGVNNPKKQLEIKAFLHKYVVGLVGLLETKVKAVHLGELYHKVFQGWCFSSNISYHPGGRIILAWKHGIFQVNIIKATSQLMHCFIEPVSKVHSFYCTFIYAFNQCGEREVLWHDLAQLYTTDPWLIMGDFNFVRYPNERIGAVIRAHEMMPMNNWCAGCDLDDLKSSGYFFTWNNKQRGYNRVFSKIDRALSNMAWHEVFPTAEVSFMPEGDFDHSPALLTVYPRGDSGKKTF
ncbi:uncharacterized protein LOC125491981 [Beta vulgaris subsp. vulgaris]|uniref:uncharacterized protein LOC125491981 n=1 Tax=Beta vulgaris subsp. vulgaris TaxID=3555 RepID=UPI002036A42E|nr:uncharacterized protein LOC125491981 [Beta vulgaris subsp. vulgaris]